MGITEIIRLARGEGREFLFEDEAKRILSLRGIPVTPCAVATTEDEAVYQAGLLGFPAVLKIRSVKAVHKTELGGVRLSLPDAAAVRSAFREIMEKAAPLDAAASVVVQPMARNGVEVIVGFSRDRQFGPVVAFGLGGVLIEVLEDVAFRLAPLDSGEAGRMIGQLKGEKLLKGFRGAPPADLEAIKDVIVKVSQLGVEYPEIVEMDLNPVVAYPEGVLALDARIRLSL